MNAPLVSAAGVKERLARFSLTPNKALGQNFLIDPAARARILDCLPEELPVLEIGPGLGALTEGLLARGRHVIAVEKDAAMVRVLQATLPQADIVTGDFLEADLTALHAALGGGSFAVAGNLPYYITSLIAQRLLASDLPIAAMVFMVQREAMERFVARPGSRVYGPLAALSACQYTATEVLQLSPAAYYPPPQVHSGVIALTRLPGAVLRPGFPAFLDGVFAMRRKTLFNNLVAMGVAKDTAASVIAALSFPPAVRAEALSPAALLALYDALRD